MTMADAKMPTELNRLVAEQVADRSTLHSLSQVSRAMNAEAQRVLYHDVEDSNPETHTLFLRTVTTRPQLARLVRRYSYDADVIDDAIWDLLSIGLRSLTGLKDLCIRAHGGLHVAQSLLQDCTFQLERLCCTSYGDEIAFASFLVKQPTLVHLDIHWRPELCDLVPPHALPNLTSVVGGYGTMLQFLPGRKVTHLGWTPGFDYDMISAPVSASLGHLLSLSLPMPRYAGPPLSYMVDYLQSLQVLRLVGFKVPVLPADSPPFRISHTYIH